MRTIFWLFVLVVLVLLYADYADSQTPQRRTEPKLYEESCRDHLHRLQVGMLAVSQRQLASGQLFYQQRAKDVTESKEFTPSTYNCSKRYLSWLDIMYASWLLQEAQDSEVR